MPMKKRIYRKRKTNTRYRKRSTKKTNMSIPRPLIFKFKRDIEQTLQLNAVSPPEGWTGIGNYRIYNQLGWSLGSLPEISDFQNLFKQYRLKGARMKMFFSQTGSSGDTESNNLSNSQVLVRMAPNQSGMPEVLDNTYWQQTQAKKYKTALYPRS